MKIKKLIIFYFKRNKMTNKEDKKLDLISSLQQKNVKEEKNVRNNIFNII
jgi:hypothetical protein